jgi:hypothetical protein
VTRWPAVAIVRGPLDGTGQRSVAAGHAPVVGAECGVSARSGLALPS